MILHTTTDGETVYTSSDTGICPECGTDTNTTLMESGTGNDGKKIDKWCCDNYQMHKFDYRIFFEVYGQHPDYDGSQFYTRTDYEV